jgi:hypothetical protein
MLVEQQHATSDAETESFVQRSTNALVAGELEDAETLAQIAIGRDPAYIPARLAYGQALEAQGRDVEAAAAYAEAARISPLSPGVRTSMRRIWVAPLAGFGVVYTIAIFVIRELGHRFDQRSVLGGLLVVAATLIVSTLVVLTRRRRQFATLSDDDRRLLRSQGSAGFFEGQAAGRLVIVGVIVIALSGAVVVFAIGTKPSLEIKVGDCMTVDRAVSVQQVSAIPCVLPHVFEVFAVVDNPNPIGAPYPGVEAVRAAAMPGCEAAYAAYVGAPYTRPSKWWISTLTPEEPYWAIGIRANWCTVADVGGGQTIGSARGTGN